MAHFVLSIHAGSVSDGRNLATFCGRRDTPQVHMVMVHVYRNVAENAMKVVRHLFSHYVIDSGSCEPDAVDARGLQDGRLHLGQGVQLHVLDVALRGDPQRPAAGRQLSG